ncbi:MAG: DNA-processing protein DprA [Clostridia bacterium]
MTKENAIILWLSVALVPRKKIYKLYSSGEFCLLPEKIKASDSSLIAFLSIETIKLLTMTKLDNIIKDLNKYKVGFLTFLDDEFPKNLSEVDDPPAIIYYKGDINLINKDSISIVGTRKPSKYGKEVTEYFTKELSNAGLITISGLAYGIDALVAETTIKSGGKTIAVLAGGLDEVYPELNTELANNIVRSGGVIISEYPLFNKPMPHTFLERNRIISGLSKALLITEAGEKSGALNTASHAIEQGKELFVLPHEINSNKGKGSNNLIMEYPECFTISVEQIICVYNLNYIARVSRSDENINLNDEELEIYKIIDDNELNFDEIKEKAGYSASILNTLLITMELKSIINKDTSGYYTIKK